MLSLHELGSILGNKAAVLGIGTIQDSLNHNFYLLVVLPRGESERDDVFARASRNKLGLTFSFILVQ